MKVKVYVNWDDGEILNKENYDKMLKGAVVEMMENRNEFSCWLDDNYDIAEIWEATDADRLKIRNDWEEYCKEEARRNFDYDEREIEI